MASSRSISRAPDVGQLDIAHLVPVLILQGELQSDAPLDLDDSALDALELAQAPLRKALFDSAQEIVGGTIGRGLDWSEARRSQTVQGTHAHRMRRPARKTGVEVQVAARCSCAATGGHQATCDERLLDKQQPGGHHRAASGRPLG
eukprot:scaffold11360_cov114-Isochrysis_galbana.AAC.4